MKAHGTVRSRIFTRNPGAKESRKRSRICSSVSFCLLALGALTNLLAQPQPGTVLWSFTNDVSSVTLGPDGTVYLAGDSGLYALTNGGGIKWTVPIHVNCVLPAVGSDGTIYVGDCYGNFYALRSDGSTNWFVPQQSGYPASPAIGFDNTVYFVAGGYLTALSSSGTKKWAYQIAESYTQLSPTIGPDGTIYTGGSWLSAFYPDGTIKWSVGLENPSGETAALGRDRTIYVTGGDLYAFRPDGSKIW